MSLRDLLAELPPEAMVPVSWIRTRLEEEEAEPEPVPVEPSWRELVWTCDPERRLGVREVAEASGHCLSWVYRRTMSGATEPIPHKKLGNGELVFRSGEVREWLRQREGE